MRTPGRTFPSASMPASGTRRARGPLPSPIRPSRRPLPIHSTQCATYSGFRVTTRLGAPQASCRTVPSAQADGPIPASGTRHARGPLPSPIRPSKRPLPIHSTRCATYSGTGPRDIWLCITVIAHEHWQLLAGGHFPLLMPSLIHFRLLSSLQPHTIVNAAPGNRSATLKPKHDRNRVQSKKRICGD